jgi:hypothetical protein
MNATAIRYRLDDWRVRQHFKRVESILREREVSHLSPALQASRANYLELLHAYAERGVFPRNYERAGIAPCFIDRDGRECAVAHFVMRSGHDELAHKIALIDNYATVPQMNIPELDTWGEQAGLSKDELTLIQPGYWYTLGDILPTFIQAWMVGFILVALNAFFAFRKQKGIILPILGLVPIISLTWAAIDCLEKAMYAFRLGTLNDGLPYDLPLYDIPLLLVGFAISAGLALLSGALTVHRIRVFLTAMSN